MTAHAALILSLTFVPAAVALLITGKVEEKESTVMRGAAFAYRPALDAAIRFPAVPVIAAVKNR
jgi:cobalt-zinc-cadmium resistance protein CzcA